MEVKPLLSYHLMQHLATKDDDTNFLLRATEAHSVWVQVSVLLFSKLGCFVFFFLMQTVLLAICLAVAISSQRVRIGSFQHNLLLVSTLNPR